MKLKTTDSTTLPDKVVRKISIFCKDCGREFIYSWKKGCTKPRYCEVCKLERKKATKRRHNLMMKERSW